MGLMGLGGATAGLAALNGETSQGDFIEAETVGKISEIDEVTMQRGWFARLFKPEIPESEPISPEQSRAEYLVEKAARLFGLDSSTYVDTVVYESEKESPAFRVNPSTGETKILLNRSVLDAPEQKQMLDVAHEFTHALSWHHLLNNVFKGNVQAAYDALPRFGTIGYAANEVTAEEIAQQVLRIHFGDLPEDLLQGSENYINGWAESFGDKMSYIRSHALQRTLVGENKP
ncbi:MAG: hypothetical protein ABI947_03650 [Chloroflexota bacterium]